MLEQVTNAILRDLSDKHLDAREASPDAILLGPRPGLDVETWATVVFEK